jgi:hypothetical protein
LKEFPDAFDFTLVGEERIEGAPAWVIDGATEVVPELAKHVRLGVVSNTPTSRS